MNQTNRDTKTMERIRELVPSLLELTFGCVVDIGTGVVRTPHYVLVIEALESNNYKYNQHTGRKYEGMQKIIEYRGNFDVSRTPVGEIFEIIGHPITLEAVLEAIKLSVLPESEEEGLNLNDSIATIVRGHWDIHWDYRKPYEQQSEPTRAFISEVLNIKA